MKHLALPGVTIGGLAVEKESESGKMIDTDQRGLISASALSLGRRANSHSETIVMLLSFPESHATSLWG